MPDWVYPVDDGATTDRYVPVLPMSKERQQYKRLLRTVGAHRLTIGQPRQSDLLDYLKSDNPLALEDLALDLSPHSNGA